MDLGFDYNKYFDVPEGKDRATFNKNSAYFDPGRETPFVHEIEKVSDNKIRVSFSYIGGKGQTAIQENGEHCHYYAIAKFVGSILCEDIILMKEEAITNENSVFTINKKFWSEQKIIHIQSSDVGEIAIKCKRIYAEKLDCYFKHGEEWHKEKDLED